MPNLTPLPETDWPAAQRVLFGCGASIMRQSPDNGRAVWKTLQATWEGPDAPPWAFGCFFAERAVSSPKAVFYCLDQADASAPQHQCWVWMVPQTKLLLVLLLEQAPAAICSDVGLIDWTTTQVALGLWDRTAGASPKGWIDWTCPLTDSAFDFWALVADQRGRQPLEVLAGVGRVKLPQGPVSPRAQQTLDVVDVALVRQRLLDVQALLAEAQQQQHASAHALSVSAAVVGQLVVTLARRSSRHHHHAKQVRRLRAQLAVQRHRVQGLVEVLRVSGALPPDALPSDATSCPQWDGWFY